jgi:hypothetical protein
MHDYLLSVASNRGRPTRDGLIYVTVRRLTQEILGFPVNLHRFRRAASVMHHSIRQRRIISMAQSRIASPIARCSSTAR